MLIVRYPDGTAITYNDANQLHIAEHAWTLWSKDKDKGGTWIASIQVCAGVIIESVKACNVENPLLNLTGENALKYVVEHIEEMTVTWKGKDLAKALKKKMAGYLPRAGRWK